ncbi:MAG: hypothetical protein M3209_09755 [Acidobacteriota bacterium]|nr:hypothetical protein [Acidobacteriota bacterium]
MVDSFTDKSETGEIREAFDAKTGAAPVDFRSLRKWLKKQREIRNRKVVGSNPTGGFNKIKGEPKS